MLANETMIVEEVSEIDEEVNDDEEVNKVNEEIRYCCKKCCSKNPNGCMVDMKTKKQYEREKAHFQNKFAKRIKTNNNQTRYAKSSVQSKDNEQNKLSLNNTSMFSNNSEFYKETEDLESILVNPFQAPNVDFDKPIHIPEPNINFDDLL
ncbi:7376_t:CDS:2 [Racocetra persica]|uniref:7376_t:CDS:1 n=1 Tax=Racocetra persica TaxID=160502 RepID=A0ACA9KL34_9GLOM|nr:7376_t:CDS:2 [Racocetra persica]